MMNSCTLFQGINCSNNYLFQSFSWNNYERVIRVIVRERNVKVDKKNSEKYEKSSFHRKVQRRAL